MRWVRKAYPLRTSFGNGIGCEMRAVRLAVRMHCCSTYLTKHRFMHWGTNITGSHPVPPHILGMNILKRVTLILITVKSQGTGRTKGNVQSAVCSILLALYRYLTSTSTNRPKPALFCRSRREFVLSWYILRTRRLQLGNCDMYGKVISHDLISEIFWVSRLCFSLSRANSVHLVN